VHPRPGLRAYETILVLVVGAEYWLRAIPKWGQLAPHYYVLLALATIACGLALARQTRRLGFAALAISHAVLVCTEFPSTGNHAYLELFLCTFAAFLDPARPDEARLYVRAVCWLAVVVLASSGLQKLWQGYYFHGEYLAFSLGGESFRRVLWPLCSAEEFARLTALTGAVGDGPYRVRSWPLLLAANGTWMLELALGPLLGIRRTRPFAVTAALCLLVAIETAAREVFFGLVFANALLLFTAERTHRLAVPVVGGLLVALALSRLGVLPATTFY
jgi:hypothetical protein